MSTAELICVLSNEACGRLKMHYFCILQVYIDLPWCKIE